MYMYSFSATWNERHGDMEGNFKDRKKGMQLKQATSLHRNREKLPPTIVEIAPLGTRVPHHWVAWDVPGSSQHSVPAKKVTTHQCDRGCKNKKSAN